MLCHSLVPAALRRLPRPRVSAELRILRFPPPDSDVGIRITTCAAVRLVQPTSKLEDLPPLTLVISALGASSPPPSSPCTPDAYSPSTLYDFLLLEIEFLGILVARSSNVKCLGMGSSSSSVVRREMHQVIKLMRRRRPTPAPTQTATFEVVEKCSKGMRRVAGKEVAVAEGVMREGEGVAVGLAAAALVTAVKERY